MTVLESEWKIATPLWEGLFQEYRHVDFPFHAKNIISQFAALALSLIQHILLKCQILWENQNFILLQICMLNEQKLTRN
jgi:hypothetical protein